MWQKVLIVITIAIGLKCLNDFVFKNDSKLDLNQNINVYNLDFIASKASNDNKLYLSILGNIYDVEKGSKVNNVIKKIILNQK